jgi:soluble lytic murein transglycosylase-like protein
MSIEGLESALARIQAIQSRIEAINPTVTAAVDGEANVFGKVLDNALIDQAQNDDNNDTPDIRPEMQPSSDLDSLIRQQSTQAQVDPNLVKAVIRNESGFNPKAISPVGAQGLMQLMPATAQSLGVHNSFDASQNVAGGAKYLKSLLNKYEQSIPTALAAYNAGPGAVDKHGGIPPYQETQNYVKNVMKSYRVYSAQAQ